jgi:hypothetical protein
MSKNTINKNYNIEKLNFGKIKKELDTIPKIIKNHNIMGLRPCVSMTDIQNRDQTNLMGILNEPCPKKWNNNNNKVDFIQKKFSYNKYVPALNNQNKIKLINDKTDIYTSLNDNNLIIKIKKENIKQINEIKKLYQRKIKEISLFYELKIFDLNKLLKNNLNEYKNLSSNYISLIEHKNIINDLKSNYNNLLNKTKDNYNKLIKELTDIMKNKTKYQDLIQRLQLYTMYEIEINEIEQKFVNSLNEKISNKKRGNVYYFNDYYLLSRLDEDINYHKKICDLKQLYDEKLSELKINNNNKFNNLINQVKNIYDYYSHFSTDKFLNNKDIINKFKDNNIINDNNNKKEQKKEINDLCDYRENVCKSISNSDKIDKNDENDEFIYQNSSQDIDNLLNLDMSSENNIKPESMKINCLPSSLK